MSEIEKIEANTLTRKQILFCHEYVRNSGNGTQAAIYAGYSKDTSAEMAHENLKKPHIRAYIEQFEQECMDAAQVTYEWKVGVLKNLVKRGLMTEDESKLQISSITSAVSELNKMAGDHKPVKTENKHALAVSDKSEDWDEMLNSFESQLDGYWKDC